MLSSRTRASVVAVGTCLLAAAPLRAQASYRPDAAPRAPRFARDTLFQSAVMAHRELQVRAEVDTGAGHRLTGRYTVQALYPNRTRLVAARTAPASDGPSLAFVSAGDPAVVVLSSYIASSRSLTAHYQFKILVGEAEQFRVFTVEPDSSARFASPDIKTFERGPTGSFTLRFADGPALRYRGGRLTLSTSAAQR